MTLSKYFDKLAVFLAIGIVKIYNRFAPRLLVEIKERGLVTVNMDYEPETIVLAADSMIEYKTRRFSCRKEPETIRWIEKYIGPGDIVYDIGANVGAYSLVVNKHTKGKAKVYAFEPSFATFAQLSKNIYLNGCQGRVIPLGIALSNGTKLDVLNYSSLLPGTALHALGKPINHLGQGFEPVFEQPIISYSLDNLIEVFHLEKPSHIKLDVDGIEWEILNGASETLNWLGLKSIQVEMEPSLETCQLIIDYMVSKDFHLESTSNHGLEMETSNYLFVRNENEMLQR